MEDAPIFIMSSKYTNNAMKVLPEPPVNNE